MIEATTPWQGPSTEMLNEHDAHRLSLDARTVDIARHRVQDVRSDEPRPVPRLLRCCRRALHRHPQGIVGTGSERCAGSPRAIHATEAHTTTCDIKFGVGIAGTSRCSWTHPVSVPPKSKKRLQPRRCSLTSWQKVPLTFTSPDAIDVPGAGATTRTSSAQPSPSVSNV